MALDNLHQQIEALVFSSETAVGLSDIKQCLERVFPEEMFDEVVLEKVLDDIREKFTSDIYAFELRVIGGGYQFFTKPLYHPIVASLIGQKEKKRLSTAALETLSIIAYRGPVTKSDCERIRGVNCDYSVEKLLEKELIEVAGRLEDQAGRPVIYKVTRNFLDYFGINSTKELPKLKEVVTPDDNVIGEIPESIMDLPSATEAQSADQSAESGVSAADSQENQEV
jgi:segregation and condensation protein B